MTPKQVNRRFQRVPLSIRVTTIVLDTNLQIEAYTADISLGGVRLICSGSLQVGLAVAMDFHLKSRAGPVIERVLGQVKHVTRDDDVVLVGVEFTEVLGPTVPNLKQIVAHL